MPLSDFNNIFILIENRSPSLLLLQHRIGLVDRRGRLIVDLERGLFDETTGQADLSGRMFLRQTPAAVGNVR